MLGKLRFMSRASELQAVRICDQTAGDAWFWSLAGSLVSYTTPKAQLLACCVHETMSNENEPDSNGRPDAPSITFKLQYGKTCTELSMPETATVGELKDKAHDLHSIPPAMQKLLIKGQIRPDSTTLQEAGVKKGLRLMLIGSRPQDILAAAVPTASPSLAWDAAASEVKEDPVQTQTQHKKVLDKGIPEGGLPGIAGRQVQLKDDENMIAGLLNGQGAKVRLTFKPEERYLWIGSAAATQKVPYNSIKQIESHVIEGHEEYSIVALHLHSSGKGKYWLYWYPSQYTAALKLRIIGVSALV